VKAIKNTSRLTLLIIGTFIASLIIIIEYIKSPEISAVKKPSNELISQIDSIKKDTIKNLLFNLKYLEFILIRDDDTLKNIMKSPDFNLASTSLHNHQGYEEFAKLVKDVINDRPNLNVVADWNGKYQSGENFIVSYKFSVVGDSVLSFFFEEDELLKKLPKKQDTIVKEESFNKKEDQYFMYLLLVVVSIIFIFLLLKKHKRRFRRLNPRSILISTRQLFEEKQSNKNPNIVIQEDGSSNDFILPPPKFNNWIVIGASVGGKKHEILNSEYDCQDFFIHKAVTDSSGIVVCCDGASSADNSHFGAKLTGKILSDYIYETIFASQKKDIISEWEKEKESWKIFSTNAFTHTYFQLKGYANENNLELKSLACTVILTIYTSKSLLLAHIGDGRAGYCDGSGSWHSAMTPFKGTFANQTIFITSDDLWNNPDKYIQQKVIKEQLRYFTVLTDGCENQAFKTGFFDENSNKYVEINLPYKGFYNPVIKKLTKMLKENVPIEEIENAWKDFLTDGTDIFRDEPDDKTLIIGLKI